MGKLTALQIKNAKGPCTLYDENGLMLVVSKLGSKRWQQRLTIKKGKRVDLGLGNEKYKTLTQVRQEAFQNQQLAKQGIDPRSTQNAPAALTFADAIPKVHEEYKHTWKNPKDRAAFLSSLKRHAIPILGHKNLQDITAADIRNVILKTRQNAPTVAKKIQYRIKLNFEWAIAQGHCKENPALSEKLALPKAKHKPKHHRALPYDQVTACLADVDASHASATTKLALKLLVHTGLRSGEVRGARWEEFDFCTEIPTWTIPAERMKTFKPHKVPLTKQCIEILDQARQLHSTNGLVFEGAKPGATLSDMTLLKLLKDRNYNCTVHGFRSTFRTWTQEQTDCTFEVAEMVLAHDLKSSVAKAYARSDHFEKRFELMKEWSNFISGKQPNDHRLF